MYSWGYSTLLQDTLTERDIKKLEPRAKPWKRADQGGLYLLITPLGSKLWRFKYRVGRGAKRKERILCIGVYPKVSLKEARRIQTQAKEIVAKGLDPVAERHAQRDRIHVDQAETFEALARKWHGKFSPRWAPRSAAGVLPGWASSRCWVANTSRRSRRA